MEETKKILTTDEEADLTGRIGEALSLEEEIKSIGKQVNLLYTKMESLKEAYAEKKKHAYKLINALTAKYGACIAPEMTRILLKLER